MENLTLAQALRHMAERAEKNHDFPWNDLEVLQYGLWVPVRSDTTLEDIVAMKVRLKPQFKLVNEIKCCPHRGELAWEVKYYIPCPHVPDGYVTRLAQDPSCRLAHARGCAYTTIEAALVEAKAQGWVR